MVEEKSSDNQALADLLVKNNALESELKSLNFLSDQVQVNKVLFEGMRMIIEKINLIDEKVSAKVKVDGS